ncbi:MAG: SidJ-related pseudokinase [Desulfobacteraceae bacterium]|nr:SidJ-related pseudokinase [Desulfobacteraceae bacterium]
MKEPAADANRALRLSTAAIQNETFDFTATYMHACHILSLADRHPERIDGSTIDALGILLNNRKHRDQRQGLFLYRQAADALRCLIVRIPTSGGGQNALNTLRRALRSTGGHAHRAAAEALGSLPIGIKGPPLDIAPKPTVPVVTWNHLIQAHRIRLKGKPRFVGRCVVTDTDRRDRILVIKPARRSADGRSVADLNVETGWMHLLVALQNVGDRVHLHIPEPLDVDGHHLFRISKFPLSVPGYLDLDPHHTAIAFLADPAYFTYPNDPQRPDYADTSVFTRILFKNAWLLGHLTGRGIVHTAPIPLFHNRVQQDRRRDEGRYEWYRAGRLDRWLDSCAYPNIGATGIRDFEHFESFDESPIHLYRHIGNHFLSLLLVTASYFRNKNKTLKGMDTKGQPVDTRHLFDRILLEKWIKGIYIHYYHGVVGRSPAGEFPIRLKRLVARMIAEMGVDRHMDEILRPADQDNMSQAAFSAFLSDRGYSALEISQMEKGARDIIIHSGPHLGEFNRPISLPELNQAVAAFSASCISGCYLAALNGVPGKTTPFGK